MNGCRDGASRVEGTPSKKKSFVVSISLRPVRRDDRGPGKTWSRTAGSPAKLIEEQRAMRFIVITSPDPNAPKSHVAPSDDVIAAYMKFNEDMHKAGVLVTTEGVNPNHQGGRVAIKDGKRVVTDGPFAESKELIAGFFLIDVKSREEAIEWALRCPTGLGTDDILTIHGLTTAEDVPPEMMKLVAEAAPTWVKTWVK
jgi:hypothetical protein